MENQEQQQPNTASKKKWFIGGGIAALVLAGGIGAAAIFMKSPKAAYLAAEAETVSEMVDFFEEKYKEELAWSELAQTSVIQSDFKITGDIQSEGMEDPIFDVINSAAINLSTTTDVKNKQYAFGVGGEIADVKVDNFELFVTSEQFVLNAPFLSEAIGVSMEKLNDFTDGELSCSKDILSQTELVTKAQQEYLTKNIGKTIYEELPDEAFTKEKNKIVMDLSKADVKKVAAALAKKMETDPELELILKQAMATQGICDDDTVKETKQQIVDALGEIEFGVVSTIWVEKGKIIERELKFKEAEDFVITGKQSFGKELTFNYELKDDIDTVSIEGVFQQGKKASDRVQFAVEGVEVAYESEESKEKDTKSFERKFIVDAEGQQITLNWDGSTQYKADSVTGEHVVYIDMPELGKASLTIEHDGKKIKALELPAKIKDISNLTDDELSEYMMTVAEEAMAWAENFMAETGFDEYFANDDYYYDEDYDMSFEDYDYNEIIGYPAPDFELVDLNGKTHRLADYEGKGVLLYFWGTGIASSEEELQAINRQYQLYREQDVEVLAINYAEPDAEVQSFISNLGLEFPVAIDKTISVTSDYNIGEDLPATVLIAPDGYVDDVIYGEITEDDIYWFMEFVKPYEE
ncbi:redoxin domain-containing protein [Lysinibacillus louembei]|uniref:Redoxin domain-containing protein n=1 Tax=Lysinibacillus louembei TaxID=1470088 RepID=A0ABZ0RQ43_9BACI|nr:redoxin domain-containing protein [Lysinibacillus louembei]WPK10344.1 redoxin domain-containing protein [Lysinibacillus louembei]